MKMIKSFQVDHDKLTKGMYVSRIDGDCITYDIRMVTPNGGVYLENDGLHTFEHLFATYVRNSSFSDEIIYVGPMGCRTGFYSLQRGMSHQDAIILVRQALDFVIGFSGEIPGCSAIECGNYKEHDLAAAQEMVCALRERLNDYSVDLLQYETVR